jgi:hypothetical protein
MVTDHPTLEGVTLAEYKTIRTNQLQSVCSVIAKNGHRLLRGGLVLHIVYPGSNKEVVDDDLYEYYDPKVETPPGFVHIVVLRDAKNQQASYASFAEDARISFLKPEQVVDYVFKARVRGYFYDETECREVLDSILEAVYGLIN